VDHEKLRKQVNSALKRRALGGLTAERGKRITEGLSSGSMMLNMALSGSPFVGYVWGRVIELFGPEQSGKTTLALHAVREAQRLEEFSGKPVPCAYMDVENTLDTYYAECIGIDLDNLSLGQPECTEDTLNEIEESVKAGYKLIVIDSVAAMSPRAEIEGEMGEAHVGLQARLMSQALRKLTPLLKKNGTILIFINQIRMKIGIMFGNPEVTTGGNALKFYSTYRLDVRAPRKGKRTGKTLMGYGDAEQDVETGTDAVVKVVKNKVFPPHRQASLTVVYGQGIDKIRDTITFLDFAGAFKKTAKSKGPVLSIPSKKKAYSTKGLARILDEPEVQSDVLEIIRKLEGE
jgi:recombination protein RecA